MFKFINRILFGGTYKVVHIDSATGKRKVFWCSTFWTLSFLFLIGATLTGVGASIGALQTEWFAVSVFCVAGMFSAAEWADTWGCRVST